MPNKKYVIKSGDILSIIAQKNNVTLGELLQENPFLISNGRSPNNIYPGEIILIPNRKFSPAVNPCNSINSCKENFENEKDNFENENNTNINTGLNFKLDFGSKNGQLKIEAIANHQHLDELPYSSHHIYKMPEMQPQGQLDLFISGKKYPLIKDLGLLGAKKTEDIYIYIGSPGEAHTSSKKEWKTNPYDLHSKESTQDINSEIVVVIESQDALPQGIKKETHNVDSIGDRTLTWLVAQLCGSNLPPLLLDLGKMGGEASKRRFLKDLFFKGKFNIKVHPNTGKTLITFKGYPGLRTYLNAPNYSSINPKVNMVSAYADLAVGTKAGIGRAIKGTTKGNFIAFFIVGAVDIWEYLASEDDGKMLTDLLVDLGVDFAKVMTAGYAGLLAGAAVVATAAAIGVSAPVWLVVGATLGVGLLVGIGLDWLDDRLGLTATLKESARNFVKFWDDSNFDIALESGVTQFRKVWSALSYPEAKIFQLREAIKNAPKQLSGYRPSPASQSELIGAIILDVMQQHHDIRIVKKALVDTEANFIEVYEGTPEKFERWALKTFTGRSIENLGIGLAHMAPLTVYDLVDNGYLRKETNWANDNLDISIKWLNNEERVPVLVGARLARISQFWYNQSVGEIDISKRQDILSSLYYVGLATRRGVHGNPEANSDGIRIVSLIPKVKSLLGI